MGFLGGALLLVTWATVATARGLSAGLALHVGLFVLAGILWCAAQWLIARVPERRGQWIWIVLISLLLRVPAWLSSPAHSDDVYRYLWDGRVQHAGHNPYLEAPSSAALEPLRDPAWARINHRELPTIYPPAAQLAFALAARLPLAPLAAWKLLVALADLGTLALVYLWLIGRGMDRRRILAWGWSPLCVIELALNAHVEGLAVALLTGALAFFGQGRRGRAGALVGLAGAIKLLPLALLLGLRSRRTVLACLIAFALVFVPYRSAGARLGGSLGEFSRRWRGNDGAFALLYAGCSVWVEHTRFANRYDAPPRLARLVSGRDRDQIYPDEVAGLAARLLALGLALWVVWRTRNWEPARMATAVLGAILLLSPMLHPWYALWIVPLVAVGAGAPWAALAVLVPLGYWPLGEWLTAGRWQDPLWTRVIEHGVPWGLLLRGSLRRRAAAPLTASLPPVKSVTLETSKKGAR